MNEQIKNSQIQQVVERYDNEKRFKNNTSVSHQELSALDEIRESVKAIFKEYFDSTQFLCNLEDSDRRIFSNDTAVALVTVNPLFILISIVPSIMESEERIFYHIGIEAQASLKNENGYYVPFGMRSLANNTIFKDKKPSYIQFKTERNLEDVARIIAIYFMNFIKDDYHYVNIEKPDITIIKSTYSPDSSRPFVDEKVKFDY